MSEAFPLSRIFSFGSLISVLLSGIAGSVGVFHLQRLGVKDDVQYWVLMGAVATASLLMVMAAVAIPDLFAECRLRFPLNLTLPVVHTLLVVLVSTAFLTRANVLEAPIENLQVLELWRKSDVLLTTIALELLILSGIATVVRPRRPTPPGDLSPSQ